LAAQRAQAPATNTRRTQYPIDIDTVPRFPGCLFSLSFLAARRGGFQERQVLSTLGPSHCVPVGRTRNHRLWWRPVWRA